MCLDKDRHISDYCKLRFEGIQSLWHILVCMLEELQYIQVCKNKLLVHYFDGIVSLDRKEKVDKDWFQLALYKKYLKLNMTWKCLYTYIGKGNIVQMHFHAFQVGKSTSVCGWKLHKEHFVHMLQDKGQRIYF